ncbi:MAG: hypothetical protein JO099_07040 [Acidobacteriia bacterium]|nr:hypothetical protein [Terriglobia bacterium]
MIPNFSYFQVAAIGAMLGVTCLPANAQGGTGSYGPYWAPPVVKGGPVPHLPDGKPDMTGYWAPRFNQAIFDIEDHPVAKPGVPSGKGAIVDPPGGKIPYKPEAAAKAKDLRENHIYDEPEAHCFESGVPHTAYQQFGFQIVQPAGYFLLSYEYAHSYRLIPTDNRPHIAPSIQLFMGDSVGHWEGDTLVVDTTNQNGRTWFDMVGNFTTPNIHVVERITPVDSNNINYEATIEDPTIYTRPWKIAGTWGRRIDPQYEQFEFGCIEGNDDLPHYTEATGGTAKEKSSKR